jgi:hypothetical protein
MGIAYLTKRTAALAMGMPLLLSLSLGGCASSSSSLMDAHAEAPAPAKTSRYLPVEDLPPARDQAAITPVEQAKLKKELLAARDRQAAAAKAQGDISPAQPAKP